MKQDEQTTLSGGALTRLVHKVLTHRRLPLILATTAIILTLPSLNAGLLFDDYHHKLLMQDSKSVIRLMDSPLDMFRFLDGDPQRTGEIIDYGLFPWWTFEGFKAVFWRPLASLTHWLDYILWPNIPALMHAQSILWFAALAAAVALLYRRFMGVTFVAGLAALLYAIDDAHGTPIGFLANRNAILTTLFGVLAIIAHDRWRRDSWRIGAALGPSLLALSLLSKEAGIATCGYLAAHALFVDRSPWPQRCKALVPYLVVVVVWRIAWTQLGYGIEHIDLYVDPIKEPFSFAAATIRRFPLLLLGQWAMPPSDIAMILYPDKLNLLYRSALVFLALLAVTLAPLLWRDRLARFWALGMVLSVVPICAAFPSDRMLLFVGIGAMGLLAQFFAAVFGRREWRPRFLLWRLPAVSLGFLFILIHLVIAPLALPIRAGFPMGPKKLLERFYLSAPMDRSIENQDLVIVNPPSAFVLILSPLIWESSHQPVPRHMRALASSLLLPVSVQRTDEYTLVVRPTFGYMAWYVDQLARSKKHPLLLGQRVELTGMTVEITELTPDNRPAEAAFRFDVPLEDPSLRWLQWTDGAFVPFTPPSIGETVELSPPGEPSIRLWETMNG